MRDQARNPERAVSLHLARSGSQSERAIWFILPAHGASHIINCDNAFQSPLFIIAPVWHSITLLYIDSNVCIMSVIGAVQLEVYSLRVPSCSRSLLSLVLTKEFAVYKTNLFQGKNELRKNQKFELLGNKKTKLEEEKKCKLGR